MNLTESSIISIASKVRHPGASRIIKGIGDDCAVLRTPGVGAALITTDVFIEGVHFLPGQPPETVGGKLLTVNLSDVAAMGGRPSEAVVALMLPEATALDWVRRFYDGMEAVAVKYGVNIVGGDVSRHPDRITLALTLTGRARRDEILFRSDAKPGDYLYVSGTLGDAEAGLGILKTENMTGEFDFLRARYLSPTPRIELGRLLARTHTASACIDLSDGIAVGTRQLSFASGLALEIDAAAVPISEQLRNYCEQKSSDPVKFALTAGGDYELLFAVPEKNRRRVERFWKTRPELPGVTCIGRFVEGEPGEVFVSSEGERVALQGGWEHFCVTSSQNG